jgi:hypothetical protein
MKGTCLPSVTNGRQPRCTKQRHTLSGPALPHKACVGQVSQAGTLLHHTRTHKHSSLLTWHGCDMSRGSHRHAHCTHWCKAARNRAGSSEHTQPGCMRAGPCAPRELLSALPCTCATVAAAVRAQPSIQHTLVYTPGVTLHACIDAAPPPPIPGVPPASFMVPLLPPRMCARPCLRACLPACVAAALHAALHNTRACRTTSTCAVQA